MDSLEKDIMSLVKITDNGDRNPNKRNAIWATEIIAKKTRPDKIIDKEGLLNDLSDDKLPQQSLGSLDYNSQNLPGEGLRSFQNPLSSASDITHTTKRNFPRGSKKRVLNPDILCVSMKKLKLCEFDPIRVPHDERLVVNQPLISSAESLLSEKSENLCPVENPTITDTCALDATTNLISVKNGQQCDLVTLPDQSNEISSFENQDQLFSVGNSDESFKEKSSFNSNNAFCNLFDLDNTDEQEEFSGGRRISFSELCKDLHPEDKRLVNALRSVFKKNRKDFVTALLEILDIHEMYDKHEFQNRYRQDPAELDIFWDRHKNTRLNFNSMSEEQYEAYETTEESIAFPPMSSTNGTKEKKCTINSPSSLSYNSCSSHKEDSIKEISDEYESDESEYTEDMPSLLAYIRNSSPKTDQKIYQK